MSMSPLPSLTFVQAVVKQHYLWVPFLIGMGAHKQVGFVRI